MTWIALVRSFLPEVTDREADSILWEQTAFPAAGVEYVTKQLRELAEAVRPHEAGWRDRVQADREAGYELMARLAEQATEEGKAQA